MSLAYLSLGSNIGPQRALRGALDALERHPAITVTGISPWYETSPWGGIEQANFVNGVCRIETSLAPTALLEATQVIEHQLGRVRTVHNGPRTVDIDILLAGDAVIDTPSLRVPHPGLLERDFMLFPLLELEPGVLHPGTGTPLAEFRGLVQHHQIIGEATIEE